MYSTENERQPLLVNVCNHLPKGDPSIMDMQDVYRTTKLVQQGYTKLFLGFSSWIAAFFLIWVIPIFKLLYVKASYGSHKNQLVFQPLTVIVGILVSSISFIFLSLIVHKYGIQGVLYLDLAEEETPELQEEYNSIMKRGHILLAKLFIPVIILYTIHKSWLYADVQLEPLPFDLNKDTGFAIIIISQGSSWAFQSTSFLYTCVLFWKVCYLQELKMKNFHDLLLEVLDPEYYYTKYKFILKSLDATSHHFRIFLALMGFVTIFCFLASIYEIVRQLRTGIGILMTGDVMILNIVNMIGWGLCLRSASKIAHLHRDIVNTASSMHASATFAALKNSSKLVDRDAITEISESIELCGHSQATLSMHASVASNNCSELVGRDANTEISERIELFFQSQAAWSSRAALVNFLSTSNAGISVYGFILDRFFVHTSLGALATTTWFVLAQSLTS